jgi:hypothetical protein
MCCVVQREREREEKESETRRRRRRRRGATALLTERQNLRTVLKFSQNAKNHANLFIYLFIIIINRDDQLIN